MMNWKNVKFYIDPEDKQFIGAENTVLICNHRHSGDSFYMQYMYVGFRLAHNATAFVGDFVKYWSAIENLGMASL